MSTDEIATRAKEGFLKSHPRLFVDGYLLGTLVGKCGYDLDQFPYGWGHDGSGNTLYFWNENRKQELVINNAGVSVFETAHPRAIAGEDGCIVAWRTGRHSEVVHLSNGHEIDSPNVVFDQTGEYFSSGGRDYDYETQTVNIEPVEIFSVQSGRLAKSRRVGRPRAIWKDADRLYLIIDPQVGAWTEKFFCEVYRVNGSSLTRLDSWDIESPQWRWWRMSVADVDETTNEVLFVAESDPPTWGPKFYIYDPITRSMDALGRLQGVVGFVSPHLFDAALGSLRDRARPR